MELPLPEGVTEADYHAIQAAVMETVRGRWFLNEFARRTRAGEIRLMLDAVERLEHVVTGRGLPFAELPPQARLIVQRAGEISDRLLALAQGMRADDLDEALCSSLEAQARAVAGLARPAAPEPPAPPESLASPGTPALLNRHPVAAPAAEAAVVDPLSPREKCRAALAPLDALSIAEKLALFA
jgi:hypothetical protein